MTSNNYGFHVQFEFENSDQIVHIIKLNEWYTIEPRDVNYAVSVGSKIFTKLPDGKFLIPEPGAYFDYLMKVAEAIDIYERNLNIQL